jgi:hypothetical protein
MDTLLPILRDQGDVSFSDMRFGVQDENTRHHETWVACKRELFRCFTKSNGIFFLSLQSEKYDLKRSIFSMGVISI